MRCALPVRLAVCTGLSLLAACGDWSLFKRSEEATDAVVVEESFEQAPVPAVDVLWVIDNSTSMCEEQAALAQAFQVLRTRLGAAVDFDLRVAVTSTDMQCEPSVDEGINATQGRFNQVAARSFPHSS